VTPHRQLRCLLLGVLVIAALSPAPAQAARSGRVLATGDSMIQIVDGFLKQKLRRERFLVRSDAHVGTGLSKSFMFPWVAHSRRIARSYRPRATVVFLGANEGFPLRYEGERVNCCGQRWVRSYAARARAMMRALERGGRSRVYWLTLPAARSPRFNRVFQAVNAGLRRAAAGARAAGRRVRLLDMGRVFTPGGRFRATIVRGGRRITVRQGDGIHLNVAGARIAARIVVRRMRRDRLFR
jgi:hypothetical protein